MSILIKIIRSTGIAIRGMIEALRSDQSFRLEVYIGLPFFIIIGCLFWPLSGLELILLVFSYILILITELVNTAVETMLDRLHPVRHRMIGISKDIASAAVLLAFVFGMLVVVMIALERLDVITWM